MDVAPIGQISGVLNKVRSITSGRFLCVIETPSEHGPATNNSAPVTTLGAAMSALFYTPANGTSVDPVALRVRKPRERLILSWRPGRSQRLAGPGE